jgi:hypothetical protein
LLLQHEMLAEVADGSKAGLTVPKFNFHFAPESGLESDISPCPKSAINGLVHCKKSDSMTASTSRRWLVKSVRSDEKSRTTFVASL